VRATTLLNQGATIVQPLKWNRARAKVSGYMWSGSLELEKDGVTYHFNMWHHGGDEMSEADVLEAISLKAITVDGKYYDIYWHTVMTEDEIYLHPEGWFGNKRLEKEVDRVVKRANYNFARNSLSQEQKNALVELGFRKLERR